MKDEKKIKILLVVLIVVLFLGAGLFWSLNIWAGWFKVYEPKTPIYLGCGAVERAIGFPLKFLANSTDFVILEQFSETDYCGRDFYFNPLAFIMDFIILIAVIWRVVKSKFLRES